MLALTSVLLFAVVPHPLQPVVFLIFSAAINTA